MIGRKPLPGMFLAITLAGAAMIALAGAAMIAIHATLSERQMEEAMGRFAENACHQLADALADPIWKLDNDAIKSFFTKYPMHMSMASVDVRTEFGDSIYRVDFCERRGGAVSYECPVMRNGERIGSIAVNFNRDMMDVVRHNIVFSNAMTIVTGLVALVLATSLLGHTIIRRPLAALTQALYRIGDADYHVKIPRMPYRELQTIANCIDTMAGHIRERTIRLKEEIRERARAQQELQALTDRLEEEVAARTAELRRANDALEAEIEERRLAQEGMLRASSREQQRIGHDLHDTLGQQLAGIAFTTGSLARKLRSEKREESAFADQIVSLLSEAVSQTRRIGHGLAPIDTLDHSLEAALRHLAREAGDLFDMACQVEWSGDDLRDVQVATQLYRIAQEALHNARRHGHAHRVRIAFARNDGECRLTVEDDGVGFVEDVEKRDGMGLRIMRCRAETIGGVCSVASTPGQGTTVTVVFPLTEPAPKKTQMVVDGVQPV